MSTDIQSRLREAEGLQAAGEFSRAEAAFAALLKADTDSPYLHLRLSEARQSLGAYRSTHAAVLAAEAGMRKTGRWKALPYVTMRLLAFEERELIQRAILSADWSAPEVLAQSPVLSQHLWLTGAYSDAVDLIEYARTRVQPSALLHYSRANALRYGGRLAEATQALEDCLALDPVFPQAHWTLAYHAPSPMPGARVDRIKRAKAALSPIDAGQVFLDYALFKELDAAGDYAAAWVALERGMRLKRRGLNFDAPSHEAAICLLAKSVRPVGADAGFVGGHAPLFVVGLPRTGTTLLERMLSKHQAIAAGGELADLHQSLSWVTDRFISNPPGVEDQAFVDGADEIALGRRYLERTARCADGKPVLIDKNPSNLFFAAAIARALPQAHILCLMREPMDACFSNLKELFPGSGYAYSYDFVEMAGQHSAFTRLVGACERVLPDRFHVVRYEDLATAPQTVVDHVLHLLGLPLQAGLTETSGDTRPVLSASVSQVNKSVHTDNIGAWRRYERQLSPLRERLERQD